MKLQEILASVNALQAVARLKLPALKAFKVTTYLHSIQKHVDAWQDTSKNLAALHADQEGKFLSEDDKKQYNEAANEILNSDIEVNTAKLLAYPADFKEDKFVPLNVAILAEHFVDVTLPDETTEYTVTRAQILEAYLALQMLAQIELPKAAAEALLYDLCRFRVILKEYGEYEQEQNLEGTALEAYRSEDVVVNLNPINLTLFGEAEVEPGALFGAMWLLTEE